jgi:Arc/MetJ-type ribon-helix-helix transcriptional regulator
MIVYMAKRTVNVGVPSREFAWLDRQVESGAFQSRDDAIVRLVRRARVESSLAWIEAEVAKGAKSGPKSELNASLRREILQNVKEAIAGTKAERRKSA